MYTVKMTRAYPPEFSIELPDNCRAIFQGDMDEARARAEAYADFLNASAGAKENAQ